MIGKLRVILCFAALAVTVPGAVSAGKPSMKRVVNESLDFCVRQQMLMANALKDKEGRLPRSADWNGNLQTSDSHDWTSGHFPGTLWYLYEYSNDSGVRDMAELYTRRVEDQQYTTDNHDVGFIIYCSAGNALRLTGDPHWKGVIVQTARSLATRYRPAVGCIQSWDCDVYSGKWQCPVIIDNMMNLELMEEAARMSGDKTFADIARSHADRTMEHHYRPDYSSYHVIDYDLNSGAVRNRNTAQGYADGSAWARGQSWGLYGFTMMFRETGDSAYLDQALRIARFLLDHPNMPEDMIPYWDYDAPNVPDAFRDVSAATIMCSALIELSGYADKAESKRLLAAAETQLRSLTRPYYRAGLGNNANFLLKHSVGHLPGGGQVDVPLAYADYYYVEALMRYKKLLDEKKI